MEKFYSEIVKEQGITSTHFPTLRAMVVGLPDEARFDKAFEVAVDKRWLNKVEANVKKENLQKEIQRRYLLAKACSEDDDTFPSKVSVSFPVAELRRRLGAGDEDPDKPRTWPVTHASEKRWVVQKIKRALTKLKKANDREETNKMRAGTHMLMHTLLKMRLLHGETPMLLFFGPFSLGPSHACQLFSLMRTVIIFSRCLILCRGGSWTRATPPRARMMCMI